MLCGPTENYLEQFSDILVQINDSIRVHVCSCSLVISRELQQSSDQFVKVQEPGSTLTVYNFSIIAYYIIEGKIRKRHRLVPLREQRENGT